MMGHQIKEPRLNHTFSTIPLYYILCDLEASWPHILSFPLPMQAHVILYYLKWNKRLLMSSHLYSLDFTIAYVLNTEISQDMHLFEP